MFVVDTNILVYAANEDSPDHATCRSLLNEWRAQATPWYLTWGIAYEFLRVTTHPRVLEQPFALRGAWSFLEALLASPGLRVLTETSRHLRVAKEVFDEVPGIAANDVFDAHTAILMREHGVKTIYTRDTDFNRFSFLDVLDPVTGQARTAARKRRRTERA